MSSNKGGRAFHSRVSVAKQQRRAEMSLEERRARRRELRKRTGIRN